MEQLESDTKMTFKNVYPFCASLDADYRTIEHPVRERHGVCVEPLRQQRHEGLDTIADQERDCHLRGSAIAMNEELVLVIFAKIHDHVP